MIEQQASSSNKVRVVIKMGHRIAIRLGSLVGRGRPAFSLRPQEGQAMVEYAAIIALMVLVVVAAMTFMSGKISSLFSEVGNAF